jgi:hypothetical protein
MSGSLLDSIAAILVYVQARPDWMSSAGGRRLLGAPLLE